MSSDQESAHITFLLHACHMSQPVPSPFIIKFGEEDKTAQLCNAQNSAARNHTTYRASLELSSGYGVWSRPKGVEFSGVNRQANDLSTYTATPRIKFNGVLPRHRKQCAFYL